MAYHGLGVLVFSTILCGSFVAPLGLDVAPAREGVRELTKSLGTVVPDGASSQETGGSLEPALPLLKLESDVDPDSQDGGKLVHSLLSASRDRLKRMAGAWSSETNRNQKNKRDKKGHQMRIQFLQDDSDDDDDDDDGCSSSSSSSESSEIPPMFYQREGRFTGRKRRKLGRRRIGGMFGSGSHASNRKKKNRCRKHWPKETTTLGRVTTNMITSPLPITKITTTSPTTEMTPTLPTTKMTMTLPNVASESLTEALFMTTFTSIKPTREETTAAVKTTQPTTQTESPTTVTYQSTTEEVKTVGVLEPE